MTDPEHACQRLLDRLGVRLILWAGICYLVLQAIAVNPNRVGNSHDGHYFNFKEEAARRTIMEYGQLPVWNPWYCGGIPGIANLQGTSLAPDFLLRLAFGTTPGRRLAAFLFLLLGLEGMFRLCRYKGCSALGSLIAAIGFTCSGRFEDAITHGQMNMWGFDLLPWAVLGFERGLKQVGYRVLGGAAMAWMLLCGGTYTVPYTGLVLGILLLRAIWCQYREKQPAPWRAPLLSFATIATVAVGLTAVRLVPMLEIIINVPRIWESTEFNAFDRLYLAMVTPRGTGGHHIAGDAYVGPWILFLAIASPLLIWRGRQLARTGTWMLALGALFFWFALGEHHAFSVYGLLLHLPLYSQLHDPYRFTIVVAFFASVAAGCTVSLIEAGLGGWLLRIYSRIRKLPWGENRKPAALLRAFGFIAMVPVVVFVGLDLIGENRIHASIFSDQHPRPLSAEFKQSRGNRWDAHVWIWANMGSLQCFEETPFPQSPDLRADLVAEEYALDPTTATVKRLTWTPNELDLRVVARSAATVVVNQNYNRGWNSNLGEVRSLNGLLAVDVPKGEHTLKLRYQNTLLFAGFGLSMASLATLVFCGWMARRRRKNGRGNNTPVPNRHDGGRL